MKFMSARGALVWLCRKRHNTGNMGSTTQLLCDMAKGRHVAGGRNALDFRVTKEAAAKVDIESILEEHFNPIQRTALLVWARDGFDDGVKYVNRYRICFAKEKTGRRPKGKRSAPASILKTLIQRLTNLLKDADYLIEKIDHSKAA